MIPDEQEANLDPEVRKQLEERDEASGFREAYQSARQEVDSDNEEPCCQSDAVDAGRASEFHNGAGSVRDEAYRTTS